MVRHLSGSDATPDPLRCSCFLGHRQLAPTVVTVTVVITSTLIAAIRVTVAFSLARCPLVAFFPGARPSYRSRVRCDQLDLLLPGVSDAAMKRRINNRAF
jgi:hypothetical protein